LKARVDQVAKTIRPAGRPTFGETMRAHTLAREGRAGRREHAALAACSWLFERIRAANKRRPNLEDPLTDEAETERRTP
jgi:hypothetical protein